MNKIKERIRSIYDEDIPDKIFESNTLHGYGLKNISLRQYQLDGVNWLVERYERGHGCLLGDEMGLGKTCQSISFLVYLFGSDRSKGPFLILSPLSVIANWQNEISRFAPNLDVLSYVGSIEKRSGPLREEMKKKTKGNKLCVVLTTYEIFLKDQSYLKRKKWHTLIVDEAHRLKNRQSLLHQTLLDFDIEHRLLLTGTPVQNNLTELYSLLCFVAPNIFKEKYTEDFLETFRDVQNRKETSASLHKLLKPFLLRRTKNQVVKELPKKTEVVLYHGMSALQKKYYKAILTKDISVFDQESAANRTSLMNILMQLRKCVNHPYLFDGVEPEPFQLGEHLVEASGKLVLIDKLLEYLQLKGHKVLIFSQMTRVLDILQDYLGYRGFSYERLDGSVRGEERYLAVQNFNQDDETFIFLLSTKAGGVGLNLVGADTVIFVDSDFNPQNDLQAAARAHRIGQHRAVKVIRLIGRSTVEEIILRRAEAKLKLTETVIEGGQFSLDAAAVNNKQQLITDNNVKIQDIIKFGFDKLFATEDSTVEDVDFDTLLGKSENGEWVEDEKTNIEQATLAAASMDIDDEEEGGSTADGNMYVFEGTDYSKVCTEDETAFEQLIAEQKKMKEDAELDEGNQSRALRKLKTSLLPGISETKTSRGQKQLTEEEKEQLRIKRENAAAMRKQLAEEEKLRRAKNALKRKQALWKEHQYTSYNLVLSSDSENEDEPSINFADENDANGDQDADVNNHKEIHYLVGDVTKPQKLAHDQPAFIIHCLDDSGSWGSGGIFSAISRTSQKPQELYEMAHKMKDISLGDAHLIPFDCEQSQDDETKNATSSETGSKTTASGDLYLALIIAQHRDRAGNLSGIKLTELSKGLQRLKKAALEMKASIHLPRIGHNTPQFNWYGTERLIRKYLCAHNIPTYIYYYPRKKNLKRKRSMENEHSADENTSTKLKSEHVMSESCDSEDEDERIRVKKTNNPSLIKRTKMAAGDNSNSTVPVLASYMSGVRCYFHKDLPQQLLRKLSRYLIAFDGDVDDELSDETTHIIVDSEGPDTSDLGENWTCTPQVVHYKWLQDCFQAKQKTDATKFTVEMQKK